MMRCRPFRYHAPRTVAEAAKILRGEGPDAMVLAGGTDVIPNLKRKQFAPRTLVALRRIGELRTASDDGLTLGAATTLDAIARHAALPEAHRAARIAASKVATPQIRNMGTIGGNLCLDTRCTYYDQSAEWRQAIDFCKKAPGPHGTAIETPVEQGICWVAPGSPRCWAVSSTDAAPALIALGAEVTLVSADGERTIPLTDLYADDGMAFLTKKRDELLTAVRLPAAVEGWRSTYWKLRRRGAFDFPILGVGAALKLDAGGTVEAARVVLGAVASRPLPVDTSGLVGGPLSDEAIDAFAAKAAGPAKPLDNTDFTLHWRKRVVRAWVAGALRELRGDDSEEASLLSRSAARIPEPLSV